MIAGRYPAFTLLLVDDEPAWLRSLATALERTAGITNTVECTDSREVMDLLARHDVGLVLLDLTMPHRSGEDLLKEISELYPHITVIVISGLNQVETAVRCVKLGAFDYFVKTDEEERIAGGVIRAVRMVELQRENVEMRRRFLSDSLEHPDAFAGIVTINKAMRSVLQYIESVARSKQPVLVTGESGVGKELVVRALHTLSGAPGPLVSVNVAGLDDTLFADTLFGHVKGAFTGADQQRKGMIEEAGQGTLFLDEIGDLGTASQVKLLRLIQEGEYYPLGSDRPRRLKARIAASTHQDLGAKMAEGRFRRDLYYRLQTHRVHIPSLRERKEDLPLLLDHLLEEAARDLAKKKPTAPKELVPLLDTYAFPGNVRELRSMVYDAVSRHRAGILSMDSFFAAMGRSGREAAIDTVAGERNPFAAAGALPTTTQAIEFLIEEAMKRARGNQSLAARLIGISQPALSKRLKQRDETINK